MKECSTQWSQCKQPQVMLTNLMRQESQPLFTLITITPNSRLILFISQSICSYLVLSTAISLKGTLRATIIRWSLGTLLKSCFKREIDVNVHKLSSSRVLWLKYAKERIFVENSVRDLLLNRKGILSKSWLSLSKTSKMRLGADKVKAQ